MRENDKTTRMDSDGIIRSEIDAADFKTQSFQTRVLTRVLIFNLLTITPATVGRIDLPAVKKIFNTD